MKKLIWKIKFYYRKHFVNDGVERRKRPDVIEETEAPTFKLYFDGTADGVYTEEEIVDRTNY